jgi:hypothetical protein
MPHTSEKTNPGEFLSGAIGIYVINLRRILALIVTGSYPKSGKEDFVQYYRIEQPFGKVLSTFDLLSTSHLRHT